MARLINVADVVGTFGSETVSDNTQLTVELSALFIEKEADKNLWLDTDPLTYTIRITNVDPTDPPAPVTGITLTDIIDVKLVDFDDQSVYLGTTQLSSPDDFEFDPVTGILTVTAITSVDPGTPVELTFQVTKKTPTP